MSTTRYVIKAANFTIIDGEYRGELPSDARIVSAENLNGLWRIYYLAVEESNEGEV